MKTKVISVQYNVSPGEKPVYKVARIERDEATVAGEKVDPVPRTVQVYEGTSYHEAQVAKADADRAMYT